MGDAMRTGFKYLIVCSLGLVNPFARLVVGIWLAVAAMTPQICWAWGAVHNLTDSGCVSCVRQFVKTIYSKALPARVISELFLM